MSAGNNEAYREDYLDDGVVALGKYIVWCPNLADSASSIPTHISISEKLKESVDK